MRTSGKILQDVFRKFHRVATIAGKAGKSGKAGKYLFFEVLLGKLESDSIFFVDFPSATTNCTFTTTVILNLQFSLNLQIEQESNCTYKNKICCISIY